MENMENKQYSIKQLVGSYGLNYDVFLPAIQRPFVWLDQPSENKIEKFFDSLLRGFPIGSFLFWKIHREDAKKIPIESFTCNYDFSRPNNESYNDRFNNDSNYLVLDGQQRFTALRIGLVGGRKIRKRGRQRPQYEELYINLTKLPDPNVPEDSYDLCFFSKKTADEKAQAGELWYKCKDILNVREDDLEELYPDNKIARKILKKLHELLGINLVIPAYTFSIDEAAEVFVRINNGGDPLEKGDFLMAFIMAHSRKREIKEKIQNFMEEYKENFKQFDNTSFLTACMVLVANKAHYKVSDFQPNIVANIEKNWEKIETSLRHVMEKLIHLGYANSKISTNIIISLALVDYQNKLKDVSEKDILDFIQRIQLKGYFDSSTDTKLQQIIGVVNNSASFCKILQTLQQKELKISVNDIEDAVEDADYTKSATARTLLYLLFSPNMDKSFDIDHIYPTSKFCKKTGRKGKMHKLFNLQILSREENRIEKSDKDPQTWLDEKFRNEPNKQKQFREEHLLPDIKLTWDKIDNFEKQRKALLIQKLKEKFTLNDSSM